MSPERKETIGDQKVEEFYWAGRMVVYVNNRLVEASFDDTVAAVRAALAKAGAR